MAEPRDLPALEHALERLKQQLPRHSIPPAFLARIEELEEAIAARQAQMNQSGRGRITPPWRQV